MHTPRAIIQHIHTIWTKASRGGDGARQRNRIPRCLLLPLECFGAPCSLHLAEYSEDSSFCPTESVGKASSLSELGIRDLAMELNGDRLIVYFLRDAQNAATASRRSRDTSSSDIDRILAFSLENDAWGQIRYNGRYVDFDTGNWWYEQSTYNIGLFSAVAVDRFAVTQPTQHFVEIGRLR